MESRGVFLGGAGVGAAPVGCSGSLSLTSPSWDTRSLDWETVSPIRGWGEAKPNLEDARSLPGAGQAASEGSTSCSFSRAQRQAASGMLGPQGLSATADKSFCYRPGNEAHGGGPSPL